MNLKESNEGEVIQMNIRKTVTNGGSGSEEDVTVVYASDNANERVVQLLNEKSNLASVTLTFEGGGTKLYERVEEGTDEPDDDEG